MNVQDDLTAVMRNNLDTEETIALRDLQMLAYPGLEYHYAFDCCAAGACRFRGPIALLSSSPFYAGELLKRLDSQTLFLCPIGRWGDKRDTWASLSPEVQWQEIRVIRLGDIIPPIQAAIWAEPEKGNTEQVLESIWQVLQSSGMLWMIASGFLSRFLPVWQHIGIQPAQAPTGMRSALRLLRQKGFIIQAQHTFHRPTSGLWSYLSQLLLALGRKDLADLCLIRMRAGYLGRAWETFCTPAGVIVARKP